MPPGIVRCLFGQTERALSEPKESRSLELGGRDPDGNKLCALHRLG